MLELIQGWLVIGRYIVKSVRAAVNKIWIARFTIIYFLFWEANKIFLYIAYLLILHLLVSCILNRSERIQGLYFMCVLLIHSMHETILLLFVIGPNFDWSCRSGQLITVSLEKVLQTILLCILLRFQRKAGLLILINAAQWYFFSFKRRSLTIVKLFIVYVLILWHHIRILCKQWFWVLLSTSWRNITQLKALLRFSLSKLWETSIRVIIGE